MFKRVLVEDWTLYLPFVSFFLFAAVFAVVTVRAIRLARPERVRLAAMPLDDTTTAPRSPETDTPPLP